jgi:hypothetical protein
MLSGVGTFVGASAVIVAAYLGSRTFDSWRRQKLSERRMEQAERILTATYKARRALGYVRTPMMMQHELTVAEADLEKQHGDTWTRVSPSRKQRLRWAQGYMSRLDAVLDERRSVDECLPMARALFGEQVEKALELLNRQFNMVRISAEASAAATNSEDSHSDIWDDLSSATYKDRPNKMNVLIAEQVKLIEDTLVPVLRLDL